MQNDIELKGLTLRPRHFVLVANGKHIELNVSETRIMEMLMGAGGGAVETKICFRGNQYDVRVAACIPAPLA